MFLFFFFFQAEDGIRDSSVTGVQTCALPILRTLVLRGQRSAGERVVHSDVQVVNRIRSLEPRTRVLKVRMDRIRAGYVVIDSVKQVFFIALVGDVVQFRRVEKPARFPSLFPLTRSPSF